MATTVDSRLAASCAKWVRGSPGPPRWTLRRPQRARMQSAGRAAAAARRAAASVERRRPLSCYRGGSSFLRRPPPALERERAVPGSEDPRVPLSSPQLPSGRGSRARGADPTAQLGAAGSLPSTAPPARPARPGPGRLLLHLSPLPRSSRVSEFPRRAPPAAPDASLRTPSPGPEYSLPATPRPSIAAAQTLALEGEGRVHPLARAGGVRPSEAAAAAREEARTGERRPGGGTGEPLPSSLAVRGR